MHAHVAQQLRVGLFAFDLQEDADRAVVVDVIADQAGQTDEAVRLHVLADELEHIHDPVRNRLAG